MTEVQETIQLPMMLAALGQMLCYSETTEARQLSNTLMTWAKNPDQRDTIYHQHRNAGGGLQSLESS